MLQLIATQALYEADRIATRAPSTSCEVNIVTTAVQTAIAADL